MPRRIFVNLLGGGGGGGTRGKVSYGGGGGGVKSKIRGYFDKLNASLSNGLNA